MQYNGKTLVVKNDASTNDIIEALIKIGPVAVNQVKNDIKNLVPGLTGDEFNDAVVISDFIRKTIKYKADGLKNQNIQLPARLLKGTKEGDCKSFSLAFFSLMKAAGHDKVGFRFASYRKNKIPTHVYNWFVDKNKNFYTFDTCVKSLKESKKHTFVTDMQVNYLTGPEEYYINGKAERDARKAKRQAKRAEGKGFFQKLGKGAKKIALAAPRNAFRLIVSLNVRGLAKHLDQAIQKDNSKVKGFWEKLGGKFDGGDSLMQSINTGKNKKPVFGEKKGVSGFYNNEEGDPYIGFAIPAAIASATPILLAVKKLLTDLGIKPEDVADILTPDEETAADESGNKITDPNFVAEDDENKTSLGFKASPLLIGGILGAGVLIYMLTKKKK